MLNKTMDREDFERDDVAHVVGELDDLVRRLESSGVPISAWYGEFEPSDDPLSFERINRGVDYEPLPGTANDAKFPWFLYWEIAWLVVNNEYAAGDRLLDMGGSASLFSYYLADKGLQVVTVDLQEDLVARANQVAETMGWDLSNHVMDMRRLDFDTPFDHVTSVCVFEHIPMSGRIEVSSRIRDVLRPDGTFSITFDFANPSRFARIRSPEDVHEQFIAPSGLRIRDNDTFHDNGKRYLFNPFFHPVAWRKGWKLANVVQRQFGVTEIFRTKDANDYTFGALFLKK